jgi:oxygen-dependent protoporphyrinogen oxidase
MRDTVPATWFDEGVVGRRGVRIVIVGGGIAGLAAALRLRELAGDLTGDRTGAVEVVVVERAERLGGKLHTGRIAGGPVETGAEAFLMHGPAGESAATRLARRVGLGEALRHPAPVGAALAVGGALRPVPSGTLVGVPSDLAQLKGLAEPAEDTDHDEGRPLLRPGEDVAVGALVRPRFGDQVVDLLVDPMLGGVYAGRADQLSLAATVPALHVAAQVEHTLVGAVRWALAAQRRPPGAPVFATIDGGMSRLVRRVAERAAPDVRLGRPVRDLGALEADAVVLAVPARPASRLLAAVAPVAAELVGALDYASVALVTLALPAATDLPDLSGFLVPAAPERPDRLVKAATFFTSKWEHLRRPDGLALLRASVGRYGEARALQLTDDELVRAVRADLADLLGTALPEPVSAAVTRWGGALPQYAPGHLDRVEGARAALPPTVALAGAAFDGVGIAACVTSGEAAAEQIWVALGQSSS